ncbi:4-oxalocrotonate tautomerase DmpI [Adlercreutzia murintestinalis]|uniref:4-oxalocrotonate tautomerase DmpI n=1 Tax=Adlercreutzia murintestinalis TaxID=2941325 RepID=UPI002041CE80|nr:4-oxalocrotonate tautomerase DmpI [Adlercreutzia murintestinalis]
MPHITVESGKLTEEQKRNLIERITAVSSEIMSIPPEFYSITIHEIDDASYGIGGKCIDVVKREYMDKHASQREDA